MPGLLMSVGGSDYLSTTDRVTTIVTKHYSNSSIRDPDEDCCTPRPVTIIRLRDSHTPTHQWINDQIAALQTNDDVINSEFLATILFHILPGDTLPNVAPNEVPYVFITCDEELPSGPYLLLGKDIHKVFRLYSDPFGAFMYGTVPSEGKSGSYQRILSDLIPVPSRSYFLPPTEARPLSGKRIAVKDIYDISGLKTSGGSKAYNSLYNEATKTATAIQKLIDQGAVIVGKTKTTQFASGAGAIDWVDYQCPFNPRGCGYLDPECSSSGSGVAVASYPWLDISIGSDSLGSMVGPAASNGIFGLRPTHGLLSNEGAIPVSKLLDTPGHFSRNISDFNVFAKAWLQGCCISNWTLRNIMVPDNRFALLLPEQQEIIESFIKELEKITKIQRTLFDNSNISGEDLSRTLAHIQLYDSYHNGQKFHKDFETRFGHKAYLDPMVEYKTKVGQNLSEEDYVLACNQKSSLKDFILDHVITEGSILLLPIDSDVEIYRDPTDISFSERAKNFQGYGLKNTAFSPLLGIPCFSFPVGQIRYRSKRSHSDEFRPVNLMILGPPGSDIHLIELVKDVLERSNRPLEVKTGKTAFETR